MLCGYEDVAAGRCSRMTNASLRFGPGAGASAGGGGAFYERTLRVGYCNLTQPPKTHRPIVEYLHVLGFIPRVRFVPYDDMSYPLVDGTSLDLLVMLPYLKSCLQHPTVRNASRLSLAFRAEGGAVLDVYALSLR